MLKDAKTVADEVLDDENGAAFALGWVVGLLDDLVGATDVADIRHAERSANDFIDAWCARHPDSYTARRRRGETKR